MAENKAYTIPGDSEEPDLSEWTDFERALYEVAKRLPPLDEEPPLREQPAKQPPSNEVDYDRPYRYPNGVTRAKAYTKLHDTLFYCYKCGAIPAALYDYDAKEYAVKCPVCRMTGEPQKDKSLAYKVWNDEVKRNLR